ncbi:MAG: hypothetical protein ACUVQ0_06835 [Thermoproteota archaeon]
MNLPELWRLSKKVYREIVFQSVFSLRTSGAVSWRGDVEKNINTLVKNAETNTMMSKYIMAFFIGFMGVFIPFLGGTPGIERELASVSGVSTMLSTVLFMIAFMGIQVATSFVSSRIADLLVAFPVSKRDVSKILLMCFIRIFDIPLITAVVIIPIAYGISYSSVSGALITLLSVIVTEIFALTLAVSLAFFFYSKVIRGGGKSKRGTLMRMVYMLVWIVPTFLLYSITSIAPQIVNLTKALTQSASYVLALLYPFSLSFLISFATFLKARDPTFLILSLGSSLVYFLLAAYLLKWLVKRIVKIGAGGVIKVFREEVEDTFIVPRSPWLGILKKDLMIASRSPSYFSILAMPIIQAVILGFSTELFYTSSNVSVGFSLLVFLPLLMMASVMVSFLPPTLLTIESTAYSYMWSLPLKKRSLFLAKTILSLSSYLVSLVILLTIMLLTTPNFASIFILIGGIYTFSMLSSIIFETMLIVRMFGRALPSGSLYSKLSSYILPVIISIIISIIPAVAYFMVMVITLSEIPSMVSFAVVSILEFVVALTVLLRIKN